MNYIVLDLEWNQGERRKSDSPLSFEIIEIGAIKLDEYLQPIDSFHEIIRPVIYTKLFTYTKNLLPLTEEDLKNGLPFQTVCRDFLKWCKKGGDFLFATWGPSDLFELQRNMEFYKIKNPFPRPLYFLDVQQLYNISIKKTSELPTSLENAAKAIGIPSTKVFHNAKNDAEYTAKILSTLPKSLMEKYPSIDLFKFPIYRKQEAYLIYPDHSLYVSRAYKTRDALKLATSLRPLYCPSCNKKARRITSWIPSNSKSYIMLGKCSKHGFLKAKRTIKNPCNKRFFESQTIKLISESEKEQFILHCQKKAKKKE